MSRLLDRLLSSKSLSRPSELSAPAALAARSGDFGLESLESRQLLANTLVLMNTDYGKVLVQMRDNLAPLTVANVLSYVNDGSYTNTFFHRSDTQNQVLQGGGFKFVEGTGATQITTKPPVALETTGGNNLTRTVGLARTTEPDTGTSQFYFNMSDNTGFDPAPGNPGYAVFGEVVAGWDNVLKMFSLDRRNAGGAFTTLPVRETSTGDTLGDADLVHLLSAQVVTGAELIVSSFTAGAKVVPGQNVDIQWRIKNVGDAAVSSAWTDRIVLSRNAIIGDSDDMTLGDFAYSAGPLAAGEEISRQAQVGIPFDPSLIPGTYNLYIVTDAANQIDEIVNDNNATAPSAAVLVAAPSTIAGNPVSVAANSTTDANILGAINSVGRAIVLTPADNTPNAKWTVTDIQAASGSPAPLKEVETWYDPVDGLAYAATPSSLGLILYTRAADNSWSFRNLTTDLSASAITSEITVFTSTDNIVHISGLNSAGEVVLYRQVRGETTTWESRNLSTQDLTPQGLTTPSFVGNLISYVTTWNGLNIAGLDTDGNIHTVWWAPGLTNWQTSNLSVITGAPKLTGGLTSYLTSWGGINIAGLDVNGDTTTTWWVPEFEGNWQNSNLTTQFNFPKLVGGQLSSYVAPWGGLNIAGTSAEGKLSIYWWAPGLTDWNYSTNLVDTTLTPAGRLSSVTSAQGTTHIIGTTDLGSIFRYRWQASNPDVWTAQDITASALT